MSQAASASADERGRQGPSGKGPEGVLRPLVRRLLLPERAWRRIRRAVDESGAEECCGVLLGRRGRETTRVEKARPAANVSGNPARRYAVDPRALVAASREARRAGIQIVGYYHSHPAGGVEPSAEDLRHAWRDASYLIVAPDGENGGGMWAESWWLPSGRSAFEREIVEVVDG